MWFLDIQAVSEELSLSAFTFSLVPMMTPTNVQKEIFFQGHHIHLKINISGFLSRAHEPTPFSHGPCPGFQYQICIQVELALDLIRRQGQSVSHYCTSDHILPSMLVAGGGKSHSPAAVGDSSPQQPACFFLLPWKSFSKRESSFIPAWFLMVLQAKSADPVLSCFPYYFWNGVSQ